MEEMDIAIIGAGVIGLAAAAAVGNPRRQVFVLERHDSFGRETSSRNSEVIHAGIYYPQNTLKATLCVEGNRTLYELCRKYAIPHKNTGKIIVACEESEVRELEVFYRNGLKNGAPLRLIDKAELKKIEPNVNAVRGVLSPTTGIIDSHALMKHYAALAQDNNVQIAYNAEVCGIERDCRGYALTVRDAGGEDLRLKARIVINCAGLESDTVAGMVGIDVKKCGYELKYSKGQYFRASGGKDKFIEHLIYPVPLHNCNALGIHATLDLSHQLRLGPDAQYIERGAVSYSVDQSQRVNFYNFVKRFLPFIELEDLYPDTAGIRPKLQGPGEGFRDFVIAHEDARGFPGFINLIGIESPGLTASPAIARMIATIVDKIE